MNRRIALLPIAFLFCIHIAFAQTNADYEKKYTNGKQLLKEGKYEPAANAFRSLLISSPANAYAAYAHYYLGLTHFKNKKWAESKQILTQLLEKHPDWKQMDEARYLLANVAFESADYTGGLNTLKTVSRKDMQEDISGLKNYYLVRIKDIGTLKKLQASFADDTDLASITYDKLLSSSNKEDKALAESLDKKFALAKLKKEKKVQDQKATKKDIYNVAILFPFQLKELNPTKPSRDNQFALDMYEGIKLGKEQLAKDNIQVNVYAYDVSNDANKALELINSPEFSQMDLLVGPLYAETNKVVATFANSHQIALINPISTNAKLVQNNPYGFLVQTSPEVQAAGAAEYASKNFQPNSAVIYYGNADKDSVMAYTYRQKVLDNGGKVLAFKKVVSAANVQLQGITLSNIGHIFISTTNQNVATSFMSALAKADATVPVITNSNFLDFQMIGFDQYERRNVHFIYPEFVNQESDTVREFNRQYLSQTNLIPSIYSYQGYDLMVYFGHMLAQHGTQFSVDLHRAPIAKAPTLSGFDYTNSNINRFVNLLKFEQSKLVPVNKVE